MLASLSKEFSLNPAWPHYVARAAVLLALVLGLGRFLAVGEPEVHCHVQSKFEVATTGQVDPLHCNSLLHEGSWLDTLHRNWQPEGTSSVLKHRIVLTTCILILFHPQAA